VTEIGPVGPDELRQRSVILAGKAAALLDEADECAIRAELAEARDGVLFSIEAAWLAEEQASEQAEVALAAAEHLTAEAAECERRLETARAASGGDLSARIEARITCQSIEQEIGELWPKAHAAEDAARSAVTSAALARQAREAAEAELGYLDAGESEPLTHERARQTAAWTARALRA